MKKLRTNKTSVSYIKNCYGCGVCTIVCPNQILRLELNKEGFYQPVLSSTKACTHCGACISVCAYFHKNLANENIEKVDSYAAWSNDKRIRNVCSGRRGQVSIIQLDIFLSISYNSCYG